MSDNQSQPIMKTNIECQKGFLGRNAAIDMLRGLTVLIMIFVNSFWKVEGVPHWLEHAAWGEDFMGLADIVFPCFLFAVGMSIPYAIERRAAKGYSDADGIYHPLRALRHRQSHRYQHRLFQGRRSGTPELRFLLARVHLDNRTLRTAQNQVENINLMRKVVLVIVFLLGMSTLI